MKNISIILKISLIISIALELVNLALHQGDFRIEAELRNISTTFLYSFVLTAVNSLFFDALKSKIGWGKEGRKRLLYGAVGSVSLTMVALTFCRYIHLVYIEKTATTANFFYQVKPQFYAWGLLITITVSLFYHAFYFYKALQEKKVTEQKLIAGTASAQFDALKSQLDPHFLFNSLNVLVALIGENPEKAQKFTTLLSRIYRYVLEQKDKELVAVSEELQFAQTYIGLLKMRFEEGIHCTMPPEPLPPDAKVVPLSLQLLLENAVKHNVITSEKPLHIHIYEKNGDLIVSNTLQSKQVIPQTHKPESARVGLANIRQRYYLLTDRQVHIKQTETEFSVSIPILTKKIQTMNKQEEYLASMRYQRAKERVESLKGFYTNALSYIIVIPILVWVNHKTTDFPWVIFPIVGWGGGLIAHGLEAYGRNPFLGKKWEERKIREFMNK